MNYFMVELHEGTLLAHPLSQGEKLPMQFGREVRLRLTCFTHNCSSFLSIELPCDTMPRIESSLVLLHFSLA